MLTFQRRITARLTTVTPIIIIVVLGTIQGQVGGYDLFGNACRLKDGSLGICTKFPDCTSLYQGVIHKTIPYSSVVRCSFIGNIEVVCCGDRRPDPIKPTTASSATGEVIFPISSNTSPQSVNIPTTRNFEDFVENGREISSDDEYAVIDNESNSNKLLTNEDIKTNLEKYETQDVIPKSIPLVDNSQTMPEAVGERTSINIGSSLKLFHQTNNGLSHNAPRSLDELRTIPNIPSQDHRCNVVYDQRIPQFNPPTAVGSRFGFFNWRNTDRTTARPNSPLSQLTNIIQPIKDIRKRILTSITNPRATLDFGLKIDYNSQNNPSVDRTVDGNYENLYVDPCAHESQQMAQPNNFDNSWQDDGNTQLIPTVNTPWIQQPLSNPSNVWGNEQIMPTTNMPISSDSFSRVPDDFQTIITTTTIKTPRKLKIPSFEEPVWEQISSDRSTPKSSSENSDFRPWVQQPVSDSTVPESVDYNPREKEQLTDAINLQGNDFTILKNPILDSWMKDALLVSSTSKESLIKEEYRNSTEVLKPFDSWEKETERKRTPSQFDNPVLDPWMKDALVDVSNSTKSPKAFAPQSNNPLYENPILDDWMKDALVLSSNSTNSKVKLNRTQKDIEWSPFMTIPTTKSPPLDSTGLDPWMKDALAANHNSISNQITSNRTTKDIDQFPPSILDPWMKDALASKNAASSNQTQPSNSGVSTGTKQTINGSDSTLPGHLVLQPWMTQQQSQIFSLTTKSPFQGHTLANTITSTVRSTSSNSVLSPSKRESSPIPTVDRPNLPSTNIKEEWPSDNFGATAVLRRPPSSSISKNYPDYNDISPSTDDSNAPDSKLESKEAESRGSGGKADVACAQYKKDRQVSLTYHILDGTNTTLGEFPHMAALGYPSTAAGQDVEWNCGGSLISERFVMTAAHCINDNGPTIIRLGKITIDSNLDEADPVDMGINEIILHPMYKNSRQYDDIALIRLNQAVEYTTNVRPACLNTDPEHIPPDTTVVVTGWGLISLSVRTKSHILLKANLSTVDLGKCNQTHAEYYRNRKLPQGLSNGHLCAFDPELKKDTCEGDSGGPLQIVDKNGISTIYGVTSFGISCASMIPAVYARVSSYIDWIEPIVWP